MKIIKAPLLFFLSFQMKRGNTGFQNVHKKGVARTPSPSDKHKRKDNTSTSPALQCGQEQPLKPRKKMAKRDESIPRSTSPQPKRQQLVGTSLTPPPLSTSPATSITLHQAQPHKNSNARSARNVPQPRETKGTVLDEQNECFKMDAQLAAYSQSAQKMKFWNDAKHWGADHLNVFGITFQKCQHSLWDDSDAYLDFESESDDNAILSSINPEDLCSEITEICSKKISQKRILDGSAASDAQLTRGTRNFLSLLRSAAVCSTAASAASSQAALFSLLEILSFPCFPFALSLRVKKFLPVESSLVTTESDIFVGRIAGPAESTLEALPLVAFAQETGGAGGKGALAACLLACAWDAATRFGKKDPVLWGGVFRGAHVQMFRGVFPSSFIKELERGELSVIPRVHVQELPSFDLLSCEQRQLFIRLMLKIKRDSL